MTVDSKSRYYLDYNSTSPFSDRLKVFLGKGDFPFANPSSTHSSGKQARKVVNESKAFLHETFAMCPSKSDLVFNSGATEGIRTFFEAAQAGDRVFYCQSDHAAVLATMEVLKKRGVLCEPMDIDENGDLRLEQAIKKIKAAKTKARRVFVNFLTLHNETGVYWPLSLAKEIKEATGAKIHVDATQTPGKIKGWSELDPELDAYSFSGHKFGALKGTGFSFIKKGFPFRPLLAGGGQQSGLRGGTENALGAHSLRLALQDVLEWDTGAIASLRDNLEAEALSRSDTVAAGFKSKYGRAFNTSNFVFQNTKADIALIHFDMAGLDVSSGSACSAGAVEASPALTAMGMGERSKNGIRVSVGPENLADSREIRSLFGRALSKI